MNDLQQEDSLTRVKVLCNHTRANFIEMASLLYQIKEDNLWEGRYNSFNEFVDDCQLSRSFASKLVNIYNVYVIEHGVSLPKLAAIGAEKLYNVIPQLKEKTIFEVMDIAETYSDREIRELVKACDHEPDQDVKFHPCKNCKKILRI